MWIGSERPTPGRALIGLVAVTGVALGLRVWGIAFGLPFPYHPDEPQFVEQALAIASGVSRGGTFANPPLFKYLLLMEYGLAYVIERILGVATSPHDFVERFRADPTILYLIARLTSAVLGASTVPLVYVIATRVRGRRAGLLAALLTAVSFLHVRESHLAVNDATVTFLTTLALYGGIRLLQHGSRREYLFAGAAAGLAFSGKYTGLVVLVPLLLAHFANPRRRPANLLFALAAMVVAVLLTFPSLLLEPGRVVHDVYFRLIVPGQSGYGGLSPARGYGYYVAVLRWGIGWPILLASAGGLACALYQRDRALLVLASLPLVLYGVMGFERMYFARFILPAVPPLLILAAAAVHSFARWAQARARVPQNAVLAAASFILIAPTALDAVRFDGILTREDTRTEARRWIESHLPKGTRIALDDFPFSPALASEHYRVLVAKGWSLDRLTIDEYAARGVEYILTSSFVDDLQPRDGATGERRRHFFADLAARGDPVAEFRPYAGARAPAFVYDQIYAPLTELARIRRPGPTLRLYRLAASAASR